MHPRAGLRAQPSEDFDAESAPRDDREDPSSDPLQEDKLDVYLLFDKDGKLQPVLGFKLEDFERLRALDAKIGMGPPLPGYRLELLKATGTANAEQAQITLELTISLSEENWVRVPLRLGDVILRDQVQYSGPGEFRLEFDEAAQEYVAWLRGPGDQPHRLTLQGLVRVLTTPTGSQIKFNAPRALQSEMVFNVPSARANADVSSGAMLQSAERNDQGTQFKVLGLAGDFSLSWRDAEQVQAVDTVSLEVSGAVLTELEGGTATSEVRLTARGLSGEFSSFQVRLPPGATLVSNSSPEYTLRTILADPALAPPNRPQSLVEVQLKNKTSGPITVRLDCKQDLSAVSHDGLIDLGGFEVPGAVRQWGNVALQVRGDQQLTWQEPRLARRVDELPQELERDGIAAGFEYFGQPYSIPVRVTPRPAMLSVEPTYRVIVGAEELILDAQLQYRVSGGSVNKLEVDLGDWQFDRAGFVPTDLVDVNRLAVDSASPLSFPLRTPLSGACVLRWRARKSLGAGTTTMEFALPRPVAQDSSSAQLVVQPRDNVELVPLADSLHGLTLLESPPDLSALPKADSGRLPWSYRADVSLARFGASIEVRAGAVSVKIEGTIHVERSACKVEQRLAFDILHDPISLLPIDVPPSLADSGQLEVTSDGQPLLVVPEPDQPVDDARPRRMFVDLGGPRLGPCNLVISHSLPFSRALTQVDARVSVPLVMPAAGNLLGHAMRVTSAEGVHSRVDDPTWSNARSEQTDVPLGLELRTTSLKNQFALQVRLEAVPRRRQLVVERAWIQTWFGEFARQDRAVYQFRTRDEAFRLSLPAGAAIMQVLLDDKVVVPREGRTPDELVIPLVAEASRTGPANPRSVSRRDQDRARRLDIRYRFAVRNTGRLPGRIALPRLPSQVWVRRAYWQLVLPSNEHLIWGPSDWSSESKWAWTGFYWGLRPVWEQADLESWCGVKIESTPLPESTHRHLFTTMGANSDVTIATAGRSIIVLVAAGAALLAGFAWIYLPFLRRPVVLLLLATALVSASMLVPDATLMAAQASVLGLLLACMSGLLERGVARRRGKDPAARVSADLALAGGSTRTHAPLLAGPRGSTTGVAFAARAHATEDSA